MDERQDMIAAPGAKLAPLSPAKARILAVAVDLFYEKGFERTTVRDIADRAGILSGSLFHHFKSKQEILYTAMAATTQAMGEAAEAAIRDAHDPKAALHALIVAELNAIHREAGHAAYVLVDEWRSLDDTHRAAVLQLRDGAYERAWRDTLEALGKAGRLRNEPKIARQLIRGALAWTRHWMREDGPLGLSALADEVVRTFLKD